MMDRLTSDKLDFTLWFCGEWTATHHLGTFDLVPDYLGPPHRDNEPCPHHFEHPHRPWPIIRFLGVTWDEAIDRRQQFFDARSNLAEFWATLQGHGAEFLRHLDRGMGVSSFAKAYIPAVDLVKDAAPFLTRSEWLFARDCLWWMHRYECIESIMGPRGPELAQPLMCAGSIYNLAFDRELHGVAHADD